MKTLQKFAHRRFNPLTGEWILVSPHRTKRPWQGKVEKVQIEQRPEYDENCYLCPGNTRNSGAVNPNYTSTFSFVNDFGAINNDATENLNTDFPEFIKHDFEKGICKVICFHPNHSKTMASFSLKEIETVIDLWQNEFKALSKLETVNHIQIFENKGEIMGCSNPHPHGQIWAQKSIPNEVLKKTAKQKTYFETHQKSLLADYLNWEIEQEERIVFEHENFVLLVPFWALWPYETMLVPKNHQNNILEISEKEKADFALALSTITKIYDQLFDTSFPYSAGIHQAPTDGKDYQFWHWHLSFYPPLLRSATVKKFMVGYEMFGEPQRDFTPEYAAKALRKIS